MAIVINGSGTVTGISVGGLPDDIVDAGTLADNAVGLAQMAGGTDGNIITYDTSGNPAVVATGSDGQVLTSAGADAVPAFEAAAAGGKVLQVIHASHNSDTSISSTTLASSGLTASITPSATSSKVFIMGAIPIRTNGDLALDVSLYKASSEIYFPGNDAGDNGTADHVNMGPYSFAYLDSPSTTSATTYTIYVRSTGGSSTFNIFSNGQYGTMTLMEIAG
jgi:hypothetical protein